MKSSLNLEKLTIVKKIQHDNITQAQHVFVRTPISASGAIVRELIKNYDGIALDSQDPSSPSFLRAQVLLIWNFCTKRLMRKAVSSIFNYPKSNGHSS